MESGIEIESTQRTIRLFAFDEDGNANVIPKITFTKSFIAHRSSIIIIIYHAIEAIQFEEMKKTKNFKFLIVCIFIFFTGFHR